jgi:hypothetical protein
MSGKSIDYPYPNLYSRKFVTPCMWQVSWLAFLLKNLPICRSRQWHCSVSTSLKKIRRHTVAGTAQAFFIKYLIPF